MSESRRHYSRDFKVSAVRQLEGSEKSLSEVARSLGIHETMLRKWRNQVRERGEESFDDSGRQEMSQLMRLERENKRLKEEMEILKKTLAYLERQDQ